MQILEFYCQEEGQIQSLQCLSMRSVHSSNLELLPYSHIGRLSYLERRVPYTFRNNHEFSD
ncbi:uncharacterized protein METZ01_LOCUS94315 [marine metagenome]|uniref:Uncharacterized protein n=1 Tax=marine metagenome TaxID=408172 RepID=A0A381VN26_9ZZZZ